MQWLNFTEHSSVDAIAAGNALMRKLACEASAADAQLAAKKRHAMRMLVFGLPDQDLVGPCAQADSHVIGFIVVHCCRPVLFEMM